MRIRVGIGYDIHSIKPGDRGMYLGGVKVSDTFYLAGHSDGDALCHAIVDAILGSTSSGNIGISFPEDEKNRDRRSIEFLMEVAESIRGRWRILNVDAVVVIEKVRLAGFVSSMTENVARALGIESEQVNVKPKSGNGSSPGFVQVHAVCLLEKVG
ncbi:MAG: 2-C-methyl-D-erythritol 2,4-cyclodiphosphate synthase [Mesotoga sp.]|jgi:2-C-methyl-D-erythritol 2,4-cyclodiphosphate synthase|nr:2-C-methyl-D-erythritol 2,4-cyclodiphosphate synthase [Thermotogota bacterium]MCP5461353.1 2-C-methyl-D-erythritol 2,4-cyclodiphosphate synthase [Thermotogota bacterium]RLL87786.1 2-C-methyl-D-erythritol 2,4-cyclodiphosphate synthase [Mesotoga sp. H07pep.5.4]CCU85969.1 2-C-methyl-D-erythritol 2,4-cyclodiphosphate synthase [Mesotoga infera]HOZ98730.1 2-C-methyl-D-erythritol 2,4-cyclodiphosphate synthase [Mesotoga prima]